MKKLIALLLAAVLIFGLVACGNNPVETAPVETVPVETVPVETAPTEPPLYDLDGYLTNEGVFALIGEEYPLLLIDTGFMPTWNTSLSLYFVENIQLHADTFRFHVYDADYYGYDYSYKMDAFEIRLENASIARIIHTGENGTLISDTTGANTSEIVLHRTIKDIPVFNTILVLKTAKGYRVVNLMSYTPIPR